MQPQKIPPFSSSRETPIAQPKQFTQEEIDGRYFQYGYHDLAGNAKGGPVSRFAFLVPILCSFALAGEPREGVENPEPVSAPKAATNQPPIKLQSTNQPSLPPSQPGPTPTKRPLAIILRNVVEIETPGLTVIVADPCYLRDLTNIYPFRVLSKVALPEP